MSKDFFLCPHCCEMHELNSFKSGKDRYSSLCASCKRKGKKEKWINPDLKLFIQDKGLTFKNKSNSRIDYKTQLEKYFSDKDKYILNIIQKSHQFQKEKLQNGNAGSKELLKILKIYNSAISLTTKKVKKRYDDINIFFNDIQEELIYLNENITYHIDLNEVGSINFNVESTLSLKSLKKYLNRFYLTSDTLPKNTRKKRADFKNNRRLLLNEIIPNLCPYCGREGTTLDHIFPISKGGSPTEISNIQYCCDYCNNLKANYEPEFFEKHMNTTLKDSKNKVIDTTDKIDNLLSEIEYLKFMLNAKESELLKLNSQVTETVRKQTKILANLYELEYL